MKIVISGGAGFIGSHIAEYWYNQGAEVHVLDDFSSGTMENLKHLEKTVIHKGSITDPKLVDKVLTKTDFVFNLAAMVSVSESFIKPKECVETNINGLINLLEASKRNKVKKLILSSSAAVYGDDPELPKKTNMAANPISPYGVTKLGGELFCKIYTDGIGLGAIALRYFNVFGPRQNPESQYAAVVPIFIKKALEDKDLVIYGNGNQTRDFIFVDDVVEANVRAAESQYKSGVFNVATGKAVKIIELARLIIQLTNSKSRIVFDKQRDGDIVDSLADIKTTEQLLNFYPKNSFIEGLKKTIDFIKRTER